ncbi:MAG: hypothetical protein BECKG1743D_GA0114223_100878 [Candidatus Kentron sp. G]|nr:MAG: hypothetical protein BECKG1743F_GA0114225_102032 [Candidatus Kentron sp. G]VFM98850.1 MAG: hypothetical protein BECKG1743D_GA0114223_100878 [Candidatus Kentron sp. G]VFN00287.1 MAG: hypothetical protein BECKG1743E_GA0114224_103182 [Candidatus Kentron sp. G]
MTSVATEKENVHPIRGQLPTEIETEDRFTRMLDELRQDREEQARKWDEQKREDDRKWAEQARKWEEQKQEDRQKREEQARKWEEQKREDRQKWEEQSRKWDEQKREDDRKWDEQKQEDDRKWAEQARKWEEQKQEDRQKREEQARKWEEQKREDRQKWEEQSRKWDEQKREDDRKWDEQKQEDDRKWAEQARKWEEQKQEDRQKREEQARKWEEQKREDKQKWEESNRRFDEMLEKIMTQATKHERSIGALGSRWGLQSERAFRDALAAILEGSFGVQVINVNEFDDKGEVFGRPDQVEIDVIIKNGLMILCELKSSVSKPDMHLFERKARFYEKRRGRKADRLMVISPMIDDRAREMGEKLGIEMYSDSVDVPV